MGVTQYYPEATLRYLHEEIGEPLQRVLVHGVDDIEVSDAEVHDGTPVSHRPVPFAALVDFFLRHLGLRHLSKPKMTIIVEQRGVCVRPVQPLFTLVVLKDYDTSNVLLPCL